MDGLSERDHALQAAAVAVADSEASTLVVAALLHDVGCLLQHPADDLAGIYADNQHEEVGADWLATRFRPEVSEPVRAHVLAKRYLCTVDPDYLDSLSTASMWALAAQGGPLREFRAADFECAPYFQDALKLRRIDDRANVSGLRVPPLCDYVGHIETLLIRSVA